MKIIKVSILIFLFVFAQAGATSEINMSSPTKLWGYGLMIAGGSLLILSKTMTPKGTNVPNTHDPVTAVLGTASDVSESLPAALASTAGFSLGAIGALMFLSDLATDLTPLEKDELSTNFQGSKEILAIAVDKGEMPRDQNLLSISQHYVCKSCDTDFDKNEKILEDMNEMAQVASLYSVEDLQNPQSRFNILNIIEKTLGGEENIAFGTIFFVSALE